MKKREAKFQLKFNEWLKKNYHLSAAFELKDTRGKNSLPFAEVKDHQIRALKVARHSQMVYKIPDDSQSYKPFDCISLVHVPAYVVIKYPKKFVMITVDAFVQESVNSKRRSLTFDRAKEIAWKVV